MELRHLRYFVAVAEELNFTRAAERLNMAQPPLSTQIRSLEEELGTRLFDRDKRRVDLTQAGRQMLVRARAILAAADDAVKEARRAAAGDIGELQLGYAALAKRASISVTDLRDQALIAYPRDSGVGLYWRIIDLCVKAGFQPHIVREARDASVMMGLVSAGIGISIVPADTQCIRLEGVVYRRMQGPEAFSALHIAYRTADRNEHLLALLTELRRSHATKVPTSRRKRAP